MAKCNISLTEKFLTKVLQEYKMKTSWKEWQQKDISYFYKKIGGVTDGILRNEDFWCVFHLPDLNLVIMSVVFMLDRYVTLSKCLEFL